MRLLLPLILWLALPAVSSAQAQLCISTRHLLTDLARTTGVSEQGPVRPPQQIIDEYGLEFRNGQWTVGALALVDPALAPHAELRELGVHVNSRIGNIWTMRIPLHRLTEVATVQGVRHIETGGKLSPELRNSRFDTRTDSVHAGLGGLSRAFTGKDVVIGIIDWGFDYTHPVFYDTSLTELRLAKAWDQNKTSGPHPAGYDYGASYESMDELLTAQEDTLYVFGPSSHGTHVGGIAGGNGAGTDHKGIAPEAELVFVSLRRDPVGFLDAATYIIDHAASVGKPCVINMSFGSHLGPHDGSSLENQAIDALSGQGRVFVGSAGNNGTAPFHLSRDFTQNADTLFTEVRFGGPADAFGQTLSMWGSANSSFSVAIRMVNVQNETVYQTPFFHSAEEPLQTDTILLSDFDTLITRVAATAQVVFNDKPNIRMEVKRTGPLKVILVMVSNDSEIHIWNNVRMNNRYTNWGEPLVASYPNAEAGNTDYGLGEPAGVGRNVITVASHRAEAVTGNGTVIYGNLSNFSSRGPTVDGRTKPDISAPGQAVRSSVNSFNPQYENVTFGTVFFNGRNYPFDNFSGTSMSAPAVTGVVALMLEANPQLTADEVKEIIRYTARIDDRTGDIGPEGTLDWGWGKVNALAAVLACDALASVGSPIRLQDLTVRPNPTDGNLTLSGIHARTVRVFDLNGRPVLETTVSAPSGSVTIDMGALPSGVYIIEATGDDGAGFARVVRQ